HVAQTLAAARLDEGPVEPIVDLGVPLRGGNLERTIHTYEVVSQLMYLIIIYILGRQLAGEPVERTPNVSQLTRPRVVDLAHEDTAIDADLYESRLLQMAERLPDRAAADIEPVSDGFLVDAQSGLQLLVENHAFQFSQHGRAEGLTL